MTAADGLDTPYAEPTVRSGVAVVEGRLQGSLASS